MSQTAVDTYSVNVLWCLTEGPLVGSYAEVLQAGASSQQAGQRLASDCCVLQRESTERAAGVSQALQHLVVESRHRTDVEHFEVTTLNSEASKTVSWSAKF